MHIQKTYIWQNSFNLPLDVNIIQVETISFQGNKFLGLDTLVKVVWNSFCYAEL